MIIAIMMKNHHPSTDFVVVAMASLIIIPVILLYFNSQPEFFKTILIENIISLDVERLQFFYQSRSFTVSGLLLVSKRKRMKSFWMPSIVIRRNNNQLMLLALTPKYFTADKTFSSKENVTEWCREIGSQNNIVVVIKKR